MSVFYADTCDHMFTLHAKEALQMLEGVRTRYLQGKIYFRNERNGEVCFCREGNLNWKHVKLYQERGLSLQPGNIITKEVIYQAYKILTEAYAQEKSFEPKSLQDSCREALGERLRPELNNRKFWTLSYFLLRHENLEVLSGFEGMKNRKMVLFLL